jgi:hypothetical protein
MALDVEDGGLGMALSGRLGGTGKAALKEDGGGLWHNDDAVANFAAEQIC